MGCTRLSKSLHRSSGSGIDKLPLGAFDRHTSSSSIAEVEKHLQQPVQSNWSGTLMSRSGSFLGAIGLGSDDYSAAHRATLGRETGDHTPRPHRAAAGRETSDHTTRPESPTFRFSLWPGAPKPAVQAKPIKLTPSIFVSVFGKRDC